MLLLPAEDRPQPQGFEGSKASKYLPHRGPGTVLKDGQTERRPATGGTVEDLLCLDTFAQVLEAREGSEGLPRTQRQGWTRPVPVDLTEWTPGQVVKC